MEVWKPVGAVCSSPLPLPRRSRVNTGSLTSSRISPTEFLERVSFWAVPILEYKGETLALENAYQFEGKTLRQLGSGPIEE